MLPERGKKIKESDYYMFLISNPASLNTNTEKLF